MKTNDVYFALPRKLRIGRAIMGKVKLSDGTILPDFYFESLDDINRKIAKDPRNHGTICEFNPKSPYRKQYLNPDATVLDFARLFSSKKGRARGELRATCLKLRVTPNLLRQILADQMEIPAESLDLSMKVCDIRLPVADNDPYSWVTFVCWMRPYFGQRPYTLSTVADMTIEELFNFWLK